MVLSYVKNLLEDRRALEGMREANRRLTEENAKLREAHTGRSFADIGTSSDDLETSKVSQPVPTSQDATSARFPVPVMECLAMSMTGVDTLKALGSGE
jgi:hypothetical protein